MRRGIGVPLALAGVLALTLLVAGCGGGSSDDAAQTVLRFAAPESPAQSASLDPDSPSQAESRILLYLYRAHGQERWYPAIREVQVGRRMVANVATSLGSGGRRASRAICSAVMEPRVVRRTRVQYGAWGHLVCRG